MARVRHDQQARSRRDWPTREGFSLATAAHPLRLDDPNTALPRGALRHLPEELARRCIAARHVGARLLPGVWSAVGAGVRTRYAGRVAWSR